MYTINPIETPFIKRYKQNSAIMTVLRFAGSQRTKIEDWAINLQDKKKKKANKFEWTEITMAHDVHRI